MLKSLASLQTFTLLTALALAPSAHAGLSGLMPAKISESANKLIAKQSLKTSVKLLDLDVYDGVSMGVRYRIESEPSYVDNYYTRVDRYEFDQGVNIGDLIDGLDLPMGFSIKKNTDVVFARQFKSQKDSVTSLPYTFKNFPITAERALNNLRPGDFVAFETQTSFVISLNASLPVVKEILEAKAYSHAIVSGDFMVHVFRMAGNKVRIKFIAIRNQGYKFGAKLEVLPLSIIGMKVVDKQIQKIANLNPGSLSVSRNNSDLFMLDYVFNLDNSMASKAFTDIMTRKSRFKDASLINPAAKSLELAKKIMTDATDIEELFEHDKSLPVAQRRVDRIFKGYNSAASVDSRFKVGLATVKFEKGTSFTKNEVVSYDKNDRELHYLLDTYSSDFNSQLLLGMLGGKLNLRASLLFATDKEFNPTQFVALTMSRERKMRYMSGRDFRGIQAEVKKVLPAAVYARINWNTGNIGFASQNNGYFKHELVFQPDGLKYMPQIHWRQMYDKIVVHLEALGGPKVSTRYSNPELSQAPWKKRFHTDIYHISNFLVKAFDSRVTATDRHDSFVELRHYPLWREYGAGFLISLIPAQHFEKIVKYDLTVSAKGIKSINFTSGEFKDQSLYKSLMYIQGVISNRSFDLRLVNDGNDDF